MAASELGMYCTPLSRNPGCYPAVVVLTTAYAAALVWGSSVDPARAARLAPG
jgi:hypothetical protein